MTFQRKYDDAFRQKTVATLGRQISRRIRSDQAGQRSVPWGNKLFSIRVWEEFNLWVTGFRKIVIG
jgi:hypothetical protein